MKNLYEDLLTICSLRKSCRNFSAEAVCEEHIQQILKLAHTSPYASGRKNWDILVIKDKNVINKLAHVIAEETAHLAKQMDEETGTLFHKYAQSFLFFREAPVLFLPVFRIPFTMQALLRENITQEIRLWERDNAVKSISCVAAFILLAAESLGLGACYMTGPLLAQDKLTEVLKLLPGQTIGAIIPVGNPLK